MQNMNWEWSLVLLKLTKSKKMINDDYLQMYIELFYYKSYLSTVYLNLNSLCTYQQGNFRL